MPDITPTFPFGSQYLRGMTPPRGDWAVDMRNMRAAGFNTIRAWLVWGVLEPRPGEVDFDYLDTSTLPPTMISRLGSCSTSTAARSG